MNHNSTQVVEDVVGILDQESASKTAGATVRYRLYYNGTGS